MMTRDAVQTLSGWGNQPVATCRAFRPEHLSSLATTASDNDTLLARGMGRSYGDASLNEDGTVLMQRLDRLIDFDEQTGVLTAEAGVTLADIINLVTPKGWALPVAPGTRYVTLGGAVACNVHGKNHLHAGAFAAHIHSLGLYLADGSRTTCSREQQPELFWATCGGMGLTGIIAIVTLQLERISSLSVQVEHTKTRSVADMIEQFVQSHDTHQYRVGWIDHFAKGNALGRGIFEKAKPVSVEEGGVPCDQFVPDNAAITIPITAPNWLLAKPLMRLYNKVRSMRHARKNAPHVCDRLRFFYPLDHLRHWNRLYGKRGFYQYQCLLPDSDTVADTLNALLKLAHDAKCTSYLAVLKYHGEADESVLGFNDRGYSLALDFPASKHLPALIKRYNELVIEQGGRVYLAKDALLDADAFACMYAHALPAWQEAMARYNPDHRFDSKMAKRLGLLAAKGSRDD